MSILIKGMEMPKSCLECRLYNDPWCMAKNRNQWRTAYNRPPKGERQNDCPLIEVPPHGALIDRDDVCYQLEKQATIDGQPRAIRRARRIVADAPTIIEEEGEP